MSQERASIFENEAVTDFDVSGFTPKKQETKQKSIPASAVRAVSQAANFPSREASIPIAKEQTTPIRETRRHRTGRNVQLNIKVKPETLDAFYKIADSQGWVLGETLEKAVEALNEKLSPDTSVFRAIFPDILFCLKNKRASPPPLFSFCFDVVAGAVPVPAPDGVKFSGGRVMMGKGIGQCFALPIIFPAQRPFGRSGEGFVYKGTRMIGGKAEGA